MQLETEPQSRADAHLAADLEDALELAVLLERDDNVFVEPPPPERQPDKVLVLEAVAAEQGLGVNILHQTEREFGLAPRLDPRPVARPRLGDGLQHDPALIDLDRKHALIVIRVLELADRFLERPV